jgi:hypothetical protein
LGFFLPASPPTYRAHTIFLGAPFGDEDNDRCHSHRVVVVVAVGAVMMLTLLVDPIVDVGTIGRRDNDRWAIDDMVRMIGIDTICKSIRY